jgi:hypothetical protein
MYSYGMVCFTCISISSLGDRTGYDINLGNVHIIGLYCIITDLILY